MEKEIVELTGYIDRMGFEIATVITAIIFGLIAINLALKLVKRLLLISSIDNALVSFFLTSINVILKLGLLLYCLRTLQIPLTSLIAILSAVGVAIGLAIQDSIANVANGIVMIGTRPFKVGDYVEIGNDEGTIEELRLMNTVLKTRDNRILILPNRHVFNSRILNYNKNQLRKANAIFNVDYDTNLDEALKLVEKAAKSSSLIRKDPAPNAYLKSASAHSLDIELWYWCDSVNYLMANYQIQKAVYDIFKENNIDIPFEQLTISQREKKAVKKPAARKPKAEPATLKKEEKAPVEAIEEKKPARTTTRKTEETRKEVRK